MKHTKKAKKPAQLKRSSAGPDNEDRADWAADAVAYFAEAHGDNGETTNLRDLLADLAHLCARLDLDFMAECERAAQLAAEEVADDGPVKVVGNSDAADAAELRELVGRFL